MNPYQTTVGEIGKEQACLVLLRRAKTNAIIFQTLGSLCEKLLVKQLTLTNALELYRLGHMHQGHFLKERSIQLIALNFESIKITPEWLQLKRDPNGLAARLEILEYVTNQ